MRPLAAACASAAMLVTLTPAITGAADDLGYRTQVEAVDFRDFRFPDPCGQPGKDYVTIHDGVSNIAIPTRGQLSGHPFRWTQLIDISYGWVEHEPLDVAGVALACSAGGTGIYSEGFLYAMRGGRPRLVDFIDGGDRGDGGIASVAVAWGRVIVTRYATARPGLAVCCPTHLVTTIYRWAGTKLVRLSTASQPFGLP